MNAKTVKLSGRDLLWYEHREKHEPKRSFWRIPLTMLGLTAVKLAMLLGGQTIELVTTWLNDSRALLGYP
jgi:hypothetical protein